MLQTPYIDNHGVAWAWTNENAFTGQPDGKYEAVQFLQVRYEGTDCSGAMWVVSTAGVAGSYPFPATPLDPMTVSLHIYDQGHAVATPEPTDFGYFVRTGPGVSLPAGTSTSVYDQYTCKPQGALATETLVYRVPQDLAPTQRPSITFQPPFHYEMR